MRCCAALESRASSESMCLASLYQRLPLRPHETLPKASFGKLKQFEKT